MLQVASIIPSQVEMDALQKIARTATLSGFYKTIGDETKCFAIGLAARELGVPPMLALSGGIRCIQGNIEISPKIMSMLIRKAGHSLQIKNYSNDSCTIIGKRKDNGDTIEVTYTIEDAKVAGLIKPGSGWTKHPADMLYNRAMGRVGRMLFADILGGSYAEGEIEIEEARININEPTNKKEESKSIELQVEKIEENTPEIRIDSDAEINEFILGVHENDREIARKYIKEVANFKQTLEIEMVRHFQKNKERFFNNLETYKQKQQAA